MRTVISFTVLALFLAACGMSAAQPDVSTTSSTTVAAPTTSPTSAPATSVPETVTIVLDGGCQQMGPNCPTYELHRDGSFALMRTGRAQVVVEASIDQGIAEALWDAIVTTDLGRLLAGLGPGSCQACVDGVDTELLIELPDQTFVISSSEYAFDPTQELFASLDAALLAMSSAAELPIETR